MGGGTWFPEVEIDQKLLEDGEGDVARLISEGVVSVGEGGKGVTFHPRRRPRETASTSDGDGDGEKEDDQGVFGTVFWVNLLESGRSDDRVLHAGVPVEKGEKWGANLWVKRDFGW